MSNEKHNFDDSFKNFVDKMFESKKEPTPQKPAKKKTPDKPVRDPNKKYKIKFPEPPAQTQEQQTEFARIAKSEIESIRKAFLDFSEKVNDTVIYSYLYPDIQDFVEVCQEMTTLINNDIDPDKLSDEGLKDYKKMMEIRSRILSSIQEKYDK